MYSFFFLFISVILFFFFFRVSFDENQVKTFVYEKEVVNEPTERFFLKQPFTALVLPFFSCSFFLACFIFQLLMVNFLSWSLIAKNWTVALVVDRQINLFAKVCFWKCDAHTKDKKSKDYRLNLSIISSDYPIYCLCQLFIAIFFSAQMVSLFTSSFFNVSLFIFLFYLFFWKNYANAFFWLLKTRKKMKGKEGG